jgi:hypothetical protein
MVEPDQTSPPCIEDSRSGPVSWPKAARAIYGAEARGSKAALERCVKRLRRYVASRVAAGAEDPRIPARNGTRLVMGVLYRCLTELRHSRDRDFVLQVRDMEARLKRLTEEVAEMAARVEARRALREHEEQFHQRRSA